MIVKIYKNYEEMSLRAAELLASQIRIKPDSVIGLATGSTPLGLYKELVRMHQEEELDFSAIRTLNLDEYIGLGIESENSYVYYMNDVLFSKVNILPQNTYIPNGLAIDPAAEALRYEALCASLEIDFQLLGAGPNGHIGFNEPAEFLRGPCHIAELTTDTIEANKRFFGTADEVPRTAITMGMKQILRAKKILLLLNGEKKAEVLRDLLKGEICPKMPVSILRLHEDVTVMADEAAAKLL